MYTCEALQYSLCEVFFALLIHIVLLYFPVATFDPDSRFIYNVLSRLEAVMGVPIVSALARVRYQLTTASAVQLQPRVYKNVIISPDPQKNPIQYVEEVILQWFKGYSHRPPTWRELLQVLQDIGELDLRRQIEYFMTGQVLNGKEGLFQYLQNKWVTTIAYVFHCQPCVQ